ncbi:MAG: hypothetical protein IMZ58_01200 [Thermoplasmata archaeon]|nr:hypothetical protein [Thermoplasmata archaeon]
MKCMNCKKSFEVEKMFKLTYMKEKEFMCYECFFHTDGFSAMGMPDDVTICCDNDWNDDKKDKKDVK